MAVIHRIVRYLDEQHTSFAVSRLILLSGVPVRRYKPDSPEEPEVLKRVQAALQQILPADELVRLNQWVHRG